MAGDAVVGALRVVLGADTADLDKGLKSSQNKLAVFGDVAKASMAVVAASVGAAAIAIGVSIKTAIDNADKVNKLSQSTGTTTEEFTKLRYAAELADVSQESLSKSLVKLSKAMIDTAGGATGPASEAFKALGINVKNTDGTLKSSNDVLGEVANKFQGYTDGAAKTAIAVALFGKAGAEMIPLLNAGKQGLADSADEAEKFGLVLDKKTTMAAEAFNDNLTRMNKIKEGLILTITAKMLPAFEQFSETLLEARQNSALMSQAADGLVTVIKGVVSIATQAIVAFQRLAAETGAFAAAYKEAGGGIAGLSAGWTAMNAEGKKSEAIMADLNVALSNLWKDAPSFSWTEQANGVRALNKEVLAVADSWGKVAAPVIQADNAQKNALESFLAGQAKKTAAQNAEAETIGMAAGALERLRVIKQGDEILDQNKIARSPQVVASIIAAADEAEAAALKIQAANIAQQVMSPAEKYAQDLANLEIVASKTGMSMEMFAARQQQLAEGVGATWNQAGAGMASGFAQLATQFGKSSAEMATAAKVFGIIEATINTYTAFTKALASAPPPFNYVMAAGVLAAGMAKVAAIKSQSVPTGMMTGGSMMVTGPGGPDSVPVNMMVSPGEQIDVWRPDQGGGSDPRRGGSRGEAKVFNVATPLVLSRDWVRDVFQAINEGFGDGHRLNVIPT